MNCCLQNYTTHQFTYFIYYLFQDKFKYPKIIKIQQLHKKHHNRNLPLSLGRVKNVMKGHCPPMSMGLPITLITYLFLVSLY